MATRLYRFLNLARTASVSFHGRGSEGPTNITLAAPTAGNNSKATSQIAAVVLAGAGAAAFAASQNKRTSNVYCASSKVNECELGNVADFKDGETYEVKVNEGKDTILLHHVDGNFYCTGSSCSHYSAPLARGVTTKTHVTCPWHDAEFDLKTGHCINGPSLNSIPVFPVTIKNGKVYASVAEDFQESYVPKMARRDPKNKTTFAIVGAGGAAITAAETLRMNGFTGRIVMFGREPHEPYDRPVLSKNFAAKLDKLKLREGSFLRNEADIELVLGHAVKTVDSQAKYVELENGQKHKYDKVLVCTGADARKLFIPGHQLKNIFTLRTPEDANEIAKFAKKDFKVVVIGSSFIGMEAAASLAKHGAEVTVVGMESKPFERVLGPRVGTAFKNLLEEKNVTFLGNSTVKLFRGNGAVQAVELENGEVLQADAVVVGVGVVPNTQMVKGVPLAKDGSIVVDALMKSPENDSFFAAGDVATFPFFLTGENVRIEHWDVAMQHGRIAAQNMLNKFTPYRNVPFFWTMLFGRTLRYAGHATSFDEVILEGDIKKYAFVAYYVKDNRVVAVATMGKDPVAVGVCEAMRLGLMPSVADLKLGSANSDTILRSLKESNKAGSKTPQK